MHPAVFLDRDGTMIEEVGYLDRVDRIRLFPWTIDAVRLLSRAGFVVAVVTNQAGIARAIVEEVVVIDVHRALHEKLAAAGARVDGWYYCPHHPQATLEQYRVDCDCRKPRPGLLHAAARDLDIDLARSIVVGDRWLDVQLAHAVGGRGILVRTGYGTSEAERPPPGQAADAIVSNLMAATVWVLEHARVGHPAGLEDA